MVEIQETSGEMKQENESLRGEYSVSGSSGTQRQHKSGRSHASVLTLNLISCLQWTIENFSQLTEQKKYSPNFEIGTHLW